MLVSDTAIILIIHLDISNYSSTSSKVHEEQILFSVQDIYDSQVTFDQ